MSSSLVWSIKNGDLDEVRSIIESKNINIDDFIDGRAPIHYAADYGQTEIISYLIKIGAKVDRVDSYGISALLAAIWEGHTNCVKLLIESGALKDGRTPDGKTYAEVADKPEIRQLLI